MISAGTYDVRERRSPEDPQRYIDDLTTYEVVTLKKADPAAGAKKATWTRAVWTQEALTQDDIAAHVRHLNRQDQRARTTVTAKVSRLYPHQGQQVHHVLETRRGQDGDDQFAWSVCQIDRTLAPSARAGGWRGATTGATRSISVVLRRAPRDGLDVVAVWRNVRAEKEAVVRGASERLRIEGGPAGGGKGGGGQGGGGGGGDGGGGGGDGGKQGNGKQQGVKPQNAPRQLPPPPLPPPPPPPPPRRPEQLPEAPDAPKDPGSKDVALTTRSEPDQYGHHHHHHHQSHHHHHQHHHLHTHDGHRSHHRREGKEGSSEGLCSKSMRSYRSSTDYDSDCSYPAAPTTPDSSSKTSIKTRTGIATSTSEVSFHRSYRQHHRHPSSHHRSTTSRDRTSHSRQEVPPQHRHTIEGAPAHHHVYQWPEAVAKTALLRVQGPTVREMKRTDERVGRREEEAGMWRGDAREEVWGGRGEEVAREEVWVERGRGEEYHVRRWRGDEEGAEEEVVGYWRRRKQEAEEEEEVEEQEAEEAYRRRRMWEEERREEEEAEEKYARYLRALQDEREAADDRARALGGREGRSRR